MALKNLIDIRIVLVQIGVVLQNRRGFVMYLERHIFSYVERMRNQFKVILLTGSRQVGKSTMLKEKLLHQYDYVVLDDFNELDLAKKRSGSFYEKS